MTVGWDLIYWIGRAYISRHGDGFQLNDQYARETLCR